MDVLQANLFLLQAPQEPQDMQVRTVYLVERVSWERLAFLESVEKKASTETKVYLDWEDQMECLERKVSVEQIVRKGL